MTTGFTNASAIAVLERSYSRHTGETSCDTETEALGSAVRTACAIRFSWSPFKYENRQQIATATSPSAVLGQLRLQLGEFAIQQRFDLDAMIVVATADTDKVASAAAAASASAS